MKEDAAAGEIDDLQKVATIVVVGALMEIDCVGTASDQLVTKRKDQRTSSQVWDLVTALSCFTAVLRAGLIRPTISFPRSFDEDAVD
eukprot:5624771-Amphidinium_carterae.1